LFSISSTSIESIGGTFELNGLEQLSTLSFEQLTSVGDIKWTALGNLGTLTFPATVSTAKSVVITNTFLSTLDGINLDSVDTLDISNNRRLTRFSTQVKSISSLINIATNNADLSVELPNLIWAKEMTFRNLSSVSIPSLAVVNGSLGFYATYMESLSAPNLTTVGNFGSAQGSLSFVANEALANVTLPKLSSIGGAALIANNSVLQDISLPELTQVAGAVDFSGVFTTYVLSNSFKIEHLLIIFLALSSQNSTTSVVLSTCNPSLKLTALVSRSSSLSSRASSPAQPPLTPSLPMEPLPAELVQEELLPLQELPPHPQPLLWHSELVRLLQACLCWVHCSACCCR
jgi:hypothetical protein